MSLTKLEEHLWDASDRARDRLWEAERVIIALRRRLIAIDATLPHEIDGESWQTLEQETA